MIDLKAKLKNEDLSGLEALEYLRRLRGTSSQSLPETQDPRVRLAFGRGYRVVGPSARLDELLAAPTVVDDAAYIRVPISRREQPALVCTKAEADCFSLCCNDAKDGDKVPREGTRLYALEEEARTVAFLSSEGCDPLVVYRKRQEPVIEYGYVDAAESIDLVPKEPYEPALELTEAGIVEGCVYVRKPKLATLLSWPTEPIRAAESNVLIPILPDMDPEPMLSGNPNEALRGRGRPKVPDDQKKQVSAERQARFRGKRRSARKEATV